MNIEQNNSTPDDAMAAVYDDLHRIAAGYLRNERVDHTLQPTALVHEAYLKIADAKSWNDEAHFRALAARSMRQVLVDHARSRNRLKRGGEHKRIFLTTNLAVDENKDVDVLALDEALEKLANLDVRKARVVELRFFGGLTARETAMHLDIAQKTVESDWYFARAWLHDRLACG